MYNTEKGLLFIVAFVSTLLQSRVLHRGSLILKVFRPERECYRKSILSQCSFLKLRDGFSTVSG